MSSSSRVARLRRGLGLVIAAVVVAAAVLFILGLWNPWRLVVLQQYFANPWFGLTVVAAGGYVAAWLLTPVRNEARQRGRIAFRVVFAVATVVGVLAWGILSSFYRYESAVLARSDDGERAVAQVTAGAENTPQLLVWAGSGLGAREVGVLGRPCGAPTARFATRDLVIVDRGYGEWELALDPATGAPLEVLGVRCPEPPIPATIEP